MANAHKFRRKKKTESARLRAVAQQPSIAGLLLQQQLIFIPAAVENEVYPVIPSPTYHSLIVPYRKCHNS